MSRDTDEIERSGAEHAEPDGTATDAPRRPTLLIGALALLLVALVVVAVVSGTRWRSAQQEQDRQDDALAAGRTATAAILSYDHRTLEADFARAREGLTPQYEKEYSAAAQTVAASARETGAAVRARVRTASVITSNDIETSLLMYVDQVRTDRSTEDETKDGVLDASAVRVTMRSVDGRWLVNDLAPLG
jgi:Mce-associated membrane protein